MKDEDTYDAAETERRREAALKRMLATPPKLHRDSKVSRKPKAKATKANSPISGGYPDDE